MTDAPNGQVAPPVVTRYAGDKQTVIAGNEVPTKPAVRVADGRGNPLSGVHVVFAVASGGGTVTGGDQLTASDGIATATSWKLGTGVGTNTLAVTAGGVTGASIQFTATAIAGPAAAIVAIAGAAQTAFVGSAVGTRPAARVADANGNPVAGEVVIFSVTSGGGALVGATQATDSNGVATVGGWALGNTAGADTVVASTRNPTIGAAIFSATAAPLPAVRMIAQVGDGQAGISGTPLRTNPTVLVTDMFGNGVSGVNVSFAVASGGGSIDTAAQTTNSAGLAAGKSWILGRVGGTNTLTATNRALAGSPVTFTATGIDSSQVGQLSVVPTSFGMMIGDTVTLSANGIGPNGTPLPGLPVVWGQPSSLAATMSAAGLVRAIARDYVLIPVTFGALGGHASFSVYAVESLDSVSFGPSGVVQNGNLLSANLAVGDVVCSTLGTFDPLNYTTALRWQPAAFDSTIVSVERGSALPQKHCFRGLKAGNTTVTATFGGKTARARVVVH